MRILGIETSCDETAAAVVTERGEVLSDVVHTQIDVHAPYGGVVPELASRNHQHFIRPVIERALAQANTSLTSLDGLAVTCQPGLSGALLVGLGVARAMAWAADKPLVGVDHLVGHLLAAFLRFPEQLAQEYPEFPFIALLVSGGHTALYRVDGPELNQIRELGATRDDAAGEAYDKVAKLLGLGYPGGPVVDRLAQEGDPLVIELSRPMPGRDSLEFSFSGLKTNVMRYVELQGLPGNDSRLRDLCAAFQSRVVDSLVQKTLRAAKREGLSTIVVGGGVAANRGLRSALDAAAAARGLRTIFPPLRACTDNAAMIAYAGAQRLRLGHDDRQNLTMSPHSALLTVTKKGPGPRGAAQRRAQ